MRNTERESDGALVCGYFELDTFDIRPAADSDPNGKVIVFDRTRALAPRYRVWEWKGWRSAVGVGATVAVFTTRTAEKVAGFYVGHFDEFVEVVDSQGAFRSKRKYVVRWQRAHFNAGQERGRVYLGAEESSAPPDVSTGLVCLLNAKPPQARFDEVVLSAGGRYSSFTLPRPIIVPVLGIAPYSFGAWRVVTDRPVMQGDAWVFGSLGTRPVEGLAGLSDHDLFVRLGAVHVEALSGLSEREIFARLAPLAHGTPWYELVYMRLMRP